MVGTPPRVGRFTRRGANLAGMASTMSELVAGAGLLGRGLAVMVRRPRLFALGAVPPTITSIAFVAVLVALASQLDGLVTGLTPFADGWTPGLAALVRILVGVALVAGVVLLMVVSFTTLTLAIGSPIYDKLSEAVEAEYGEVPALDEPAVRGATRAARHSLALIAVSLVAVVVLFAVGFVPVVGQTVVPVASAAWGGWMLGIELIGSTFERRGLIRIADRRRAMRRHRARVLGFAVPTFALLAIPFAGVVVFPVATAGGTLLARQLLGERIDAAAAPPAEPAEPPSRPPTRPTPPPRRRAPGTALPPAAG